MHIPSAFEEKRIDVMHQLMREHSLATLVVQTKDGLDANHIPLHIKQTETEFGTLVGHVARNNPVWKMFKQDVEVLAIFHGPNAYISPSWYPTKQENHKVAPTWNYATVHASGFMRVIEDENWLLELLDMLTREHETHFKQPWHVSDAPEDFVKKLVSAIVGIEIPISKLIGKWKVSQNQPQRNQIGVIEGLAETSDLSGMANFMHSHLNK
jgi:transcriptional regulator